MGSRRELFVDRHIIAKLEGAALRLQRPIVREKIMTFSEPYEGIYPGGYNTVIQDGPIYRMYYIGYPSDEVQYACYAESTDGFVSIKTGYEPGELLTKPLTFQGSTLTLNFASSASGGIRVEIQNPKGQAIEGFGLADCPEMIGDEIDRTVAWKQGTDVSRLAGVPVQLRLVMKDADLYSFRFAPRKRRNALGPTGSAR